jgi:hypothetical protein
VTYLITDKSKSDSKNVQTAITAADESTDAEGIAQLTTFIRGYDSNFAITEDVLGLIRTHTSATEEDIRGR